MLALHGVVDFVKSAENVGPLVTENLRGIQELHDTGDVDASLWEAGFWVDVVVIGHFLIRMVNIFIYELGD